MRHRKKKFKLGKPADQRKALLRSLIIGLITHERIKTTYRRAKEASRLMDELVSFGKRGDIFSRRQAYRILQDRELVKKLFDDIAPRFKNLRGGYTRIIKMNNRRGDNALLALLEFIKIKEEIVEEKRRLREKRKKKKEKKIEEKVPEIEEVKVEEEKVKEKKIKKKEEPQPEPKEKEKKGFMEGLKGFFKRKKEK